MPQISGLVRSRTVALLAAQFNAAMAATAPTYGVTPFVIDYASAPKSNSFFYGRLDVDDIEASSTFKPNIQTIFILGSKNTAAQKPSVFSGFVTLGLDTWISYPGSTARQDFEAMAMCLEDVLYGLFNARSNAAAWGNTVCYEGQMKVDFGPVVMGSTNWRRLVASTITFEVIA